MTDQSTLELIPVDAIGHHPANPRQDIGDVSELVASIRSVGVLQPIAVHKQGKRFVCLMGNRRLAAAAQAGLDVVPAMVWNGLSDQQQQVVMLVENLQRADLNPVDEAEGYQALASTGMEQGDIGARVGRSQSYVSRRLRLLECDDETKAKLRAGKLSASGALRTLAPKKDRPKAEPEPQRCHHGYSADEFCADCIAEESPYDEHSDVLDHIYGTAAPMVRDVQKEIIDAIDAIMDNRLPSAAAHIANAHRALSPVEAVTLVDVAEAEVAEQNEAALDDEFADALAAAESELDEATAIALGTEQVDPSLAQYVQDWEDIQSPANDAVDVDEDTLASIHQLKATPSPVAQLGAQMADAIAHGQGEPAPAVKVTIGVPDGALNTRLVTCEQHGRLTRTPEIDFARHKAAQHITDKHGGFGEVVMVEDVSA